MRLLPIALLSIFSSIATAADTNFLEVGYQEFKFDGNAPITPSGVAITFNKSLGRFYIEGHYASASDAQSERSINSYGDYFVQADQSIDATFRQRSLGIGKVVWLSHASYIDVNYSQTSWEAKTKSIGEVTVVNATGSESSFEEVSDRESVKFQTLEAGYYYRFNNGITTETGLGFEKVKSNTTETNFVWFAGINYELTREWAGKVNVRDADDYRELTASIVYQF